jgi:hypothetical protein
MKDLQDQLRYCFLEARRIFIVSLGIANWKHEGPSGSAKVTCAYFKHEGPSGSAKVFVARSRNQSFRFFLLLSGLDSRFFADADMIQTTQENTLGRVLSAFSAHRQCCGSGSGNFFSMSDRIRNNCTGSGSLSGLFDKNICIIFANFLQNSPVRL